MDPQLISLVMNYYKREDIQEAIVNHAQHKEIGLMYRDGAFAKRPQMLLYPKDIISHVQKGIVSFHASEELWSNPMLLSSTISKKEMQQLRIGWDLVIDIDCKVFEYSKIAALEVVRVLKKLFGIRSISVKFSGNKGFHIGVPFEAFPKKLGKEEVKNLFPEAPRKIAAMINDLISKPVGHAIWKKEKGDINKIAQKTGISKEELLQQVHEEVAGTWKVLETDPTKFVGKILEIDTILISPRHLYRMPYSLNEKSWLVSLPIPISHIEEFSLKEAQPQHVKPKEIFLNREQAQEGEAEELLRMALIYEYSEQPQPEEKSQSITQVREKIIQDISEEFFPPCIKKGLQGLPDGRKRFLFILINFLRFMNWSNENIDRFVRKWNERNPEPLRESYVNAQLKYAFKHNPVLPPNCKHPDYYKDIGICFPDTLCNRIKNPVNYARIMFLKEKKKKTKK